MQVENNWQFVIVHVHMFKNAGSTFDWSLKKNFGDAFIDHRDDDQMRQGADYLGPYLKKWQPKAISSHHIKLPLPIIPCVKLLPVFILRHPIDRIGSVYAFEKKQKANTRGAIKAKESTFSDYIRWYMEPRSPATIKDFQTRFCCGKINGAKLLARRDYLEALKTLKATPLVGVVESYDQSMTLFEETLKTYFPQIDLTYKKKNTGNRQSFPIEERISNLKNELGEDLVNLVMEQNRYDLMLYEEAKRLLRKRIARTKDFDKKLNSFRERRVSSKPK